LSIVAWSLGIFGVQAPAATIKLVDFYYNQVAIAFEGDIAPGDLDERFAQLAEQVKALGKRYSGIWFNSNGGDFGEAAKIADFF
jgi:hypothetical protein